MIRSASPKGLEYIRQFESFEPERYLDAAGKPTIGYGHLIVPSDGDLKTVTKEQAETIFRNDVSVAENAINSYVKVPLTQNQYDALTSFIFNVGVNAFKNSTLLRKLNNKDYNGAAAELPRWSYAGGKWLDGLNRRRLTEKKTFMA